MLGLNSSEEINLSVACECLSVTRDLHADLLNFVDEKIVHIHKCFLT